jgi:hypothetical protein
MPKDVPFMKQHPTIFDRIFSRERPAWIKISASLLLLLLPFGIAYFDGSLNEILDQGLVRIFLVAPVITIYIWLVSPVMSRRGDEIIRSIRPLVPLDDESFDSMISAAIRVNPLYELGIFGGGVILGLLTAGGNALGENSNLLKVYWILSSAFMNGLLLWTIFIAVTSTRVHAALHRQPLRIDIFDSSPFEPIGRQGLLLAMVFVGGSTISLILSFQMESIASLGFWVGYILMVMVSALIFFLSMRPTHKVLAAAKKREHEAIQQHITSACRELVKRLDGSQATHDLAAEINALAVYEQRIGAARTWPYNTTMLRTLFFSVLIPLGSAMARLVWDNLFP